MKADTQDITFEELLSRNDEYNIPKFQRSYAWDDGEIDDFIKDLQGLCNSLTPSMRTSKPPMRHFFGGIVCVSTYLTGTTIQVYEVIDGQQRLATFIMTLRAVQEGLNNLAVIADAARNMGVKNSATSYSNEIRDKYLKYKIVISGTETIKDRLVLSKVDADYFANLMNGISQTGSGRESHKRLQSAYDQISKEVIKKILDNNAITLDLKLQALLDVKNVILRDFHVIHIICDKDEEAYRLFSILNDRGRSLGVGDLLRSYTLEISEGYGSAQNKIEGYWDEILKDSHTRIDNFLKDYYASVVGSRAPAREVFDSFKRNIIVTQTICTTPQDAKELRIKVESIKRECLIYRKIVDGEWPYDAPSASEWDKDRLDRLINILGHTLCIPLLLAVKECLTEDNFSDIVGMLERYSFRYKTIVDAHAQKLGDIYYSNAKKIRDNATGYSIDNLRTELTTLMNAKAPDVVFKEALKNTLIYKKKGKNGIIRHFLTTLEDYKAWYDGGGVGNPQPSKISVYDLELVTIEHIYPQTPQTVVASLEPIKHQVGNLSFWAQGDNTAASNAIFLTKKPLYASSKVKLNNDLCQYGDWDIQTYQRREELLIEMALKIFTI